MNNRTLRVAAPVLLALSGLPCSGKSTYAQLLGAPIVSPDAIRLALHGHRFLKCAEPHVWAIAQTMVAALFNAGHVEVVLDSTLTKNCARKHWIKPDEYQTEFLHCAAPAALCIERAQRAGDEEIIPIIERMAESWEPFEANHRVRTIPHE